MSHSCSSWPQSTVRTGIGQHRSIPCAMLMNLAWRCLNLCCVCLLQAIEQLDRPTLQSALQIS